MQWNCSDDVKVTRFNHIVLAYIVACCRLNFINLLLETYMWLLLSCYVTVLFSATWNCTMSYFLTLCLFSARWEHKSVTGLFHPYSFAVIRDLTVSNNSFTSVTYLLHL